MTEQKVTFHNAASATAVGAVMNTSQTAMVAVQIAGTFSATVTFQGTIDGSNWIAIQAQNLNDGSVATTATAAGLFLVPVVGVRQFRCNLTWTSGTSITVTGIGTSLASGMSLADIDVAGTETVTVSSLPTSILIAPNSTQADQRLTVDGTVGGVQFSAFHANTLYIFWTCEDAQCRVTFDGSAPTSTNGHIINVGDSGTWSKALATAAKFIRTGASSAVIHASQML